MQLYSLMRTVMSANTDVARRPSVEADITFQMEQYQLSQVMTTVVEKSRVPSPEKVSPKGTTSAHAPRLIEDLRESDIESNVSYVVTGDDGRHIQKVEKNDPE